MGLHSGRIELIHGDRVRLEELARSRTSAARLVVRAKIVLMRAGGVSFRSIGEALDCDFRTAIKWVKRWEAEGFKGIQEERPGRGRKPSVIVAKGPEILQLTIEGKPKNRTHWSRASMARIVGVSPSTVGRVWKRNGLKPHRILTFKIRKDPRFEEKLVDVVG